MAQTEKAPPEEKPETTDKDEKKSGAQRFYDWLSHPLVLLAVGAVISSLLIPSFTRRWQTEQQAEQTKTGLISQITSATTAAMTQLEVAQAPQFGSNARSSRAGAGSAYEAWTSQGAVILTSVKTYFPDTRLPLHWSNLYGLYHNFFLLTYARNPSERGKYVAGIKDYFTFHKDAGGVNWQALQTEDSTSPSYQSAWIVVEKKIVRVRDNFLGDMMDADPQTF